MQQEWLHSKLVEKKTQTLHTCWNDRKKKNRLVNKEIGHSMYIFTFFLFNMWICFWRKVTCDYVWASLSVSVWALFYFVFTMLLTKIFLKVWIGPSKPHVFETRVWNLRHLCSPSHQLKELCSGPRSALSVHLTQEPYSMPYHMSAAGWQSPAEQPPVSCPWAGLQSTGPWGASLLLNHTRVIKAGK